MPKSGLISILQYDERTLTRTRVKPGQGTAVEILAFDQERGQWPAAGGQLDTALAAFIQRLGIADDTVITVLPRHLVTVRILNLPTHDPAEAESMIRFSAEEYVPYPADELIIQSAVLRREPGGESKVLAVLAHKDVLKAHLAPLRAAGIIPQRVLLSTACLANAVAAAKAPGDQPYALANLASSGLEVLVFHGTKLLFGRAVASEQDWSARGEAAAQADEEMAIEVRGSLSAFRRESEDGEGADTVYLASDYPIALDERAESLANETGKECASAAFVNAIATGQQAPITALGAALAALGRATLDINLLPAEAARARTVAGAKELLKRAGYVAAGVAAALLLLFAQAYLQRASYIRELQGRLNAVAPDAAGLGEKQEQLRILRQQMKRGSSPLHMLAISADAAPEKSANITQFRYNINEGTDIFGRANSVDDVQAFAAKLRKAATDAQLAFFKNAHSMYEDRGEERGKKIIMYQIAVPVEAEGEAKADKKARGVKSSDAVSTEDTETPAPAEKKPEAAQ